ncbi:expressed unknown protein [Ectocarpus siliculosus]|uniref:Uncharacterized protein n=1 Tax=Ectocarpus siliculosus TaxID=2880 RepID=D8LCW4_ECTSI|nr:expressed unknown protein [Ectocarpus siliculosus]|eukprot:CBN75506.1 expressed unknown protein [Ectocarpus siliculosus]
MEKESLDVMRQQLAAVHQLRIDLQRKDSVIQSLQLKVQEGESARDREGRLEAHCHLLEKRCSCLESTNGEYAERLGALDQESRSRVDSLRREKDDLKRQLRDSESELEAERRRFEGAAAAHRRELAAALAEGADARGLAGGLKESLEEASAQANRRQGRWAEMEKLGSTEAFVELSGRWCGNELLALTWVEVSKTLEALEAAQAGHRTALGRLRDAKLQVGTQQEETSGANQVADDLRQELSRMRDVEVRLQSTAAQLKAAREKERRQRVHVDAVWSQLSSIGAVSPGGLEDSNIDDKDNSELFPGRIGCPAGESGSGVAVVEGGSIAGGGLDDDARLSEIPRGIRRLVSEWSDRGKGLETLTRRLREEGARRDEERAELETAAAAAREEAEARGEEVARLAVDFETRAACAEAGMDEKVAKVQADAVADANLRVSTVSEEASRRVAAATADAARQVAEAVETAERKVKEAAAYTEESVALARGGAAEKEEEADRRVSEAEEALAAARASETAAVALSRSAVERQLSAEAALKILGRFVGPLHRLCLELREQKRFLSRSYRRDAPLQAELFSVAAAVTGKDYWCLLSAATDIDIASPNNATTRRRERNPSGNGRRLPYDGACVGEDCQDDGDDVVAVRVPPSLRAVVIAVVAANRLAAFARASSAARRTYHDDSVGGPATGATAGGAGSGRGRQHRYQQQRPRQCRTGGETDARYLARAGGIRSLPVLPPWCCGNRGRVLRLPAASDLEEMADGQALETVLARLLVFGTGAEGDDGGEEEEVGGGRRGRNVRAEPMDGNVSGGGGGVLNIEALWGGGGARVGDLLYHLIRGRKDHMTGVKLEESADVLRRRVESLEAEASAKPAVDLEAFAALGEEMKAATAVGARLREQVGRLEEALSAARREVAEASAASERATAGRDEAEARIVRLDAAKLETAREVEQLKAFAIRANLERDECLERERAVARQRVDQTLNETAVIGGGTTDQDLLHTPPPAVATPTTRGRRLDARGPPLGSGGGREGAPASARDGSVSPPLSARRQRRSLDEDHVEQWDHRAHADEQQRQHQQEQLQMRQRLVQSQEELRCCRKEEERSRARCSQLETRLAEARDCLEEQKSVTASMRRAAARAHDDAEAARKQVEDTKALVSRQEFQCRRQVSLLEARLLETGARNSRRRDLLQLQACAQEDLVKALRDPVLPSTCGDTVVSDVSDHSLRAEEVERPAAAAASASDEWQISR